VIWFELNLSRDTIVNQGWATLLIMSDNDTRHVETLQTLFSKIYEKNDKQSFLEYCK